MEKILCWQQAVRTAYKLVYPFMCYVYEYVVTISIYTVTMKSSVDFYF